MIVKQLYADNNLRNFHYIIACPMTKEAMVIDPLDADRCLNAASKEGYEIKQILNTHEHWDHIDGNDEICNKTGAKILAHHSAIHKIPNVYRGLSAGDQIQIGSSVTLKVLHTPGHTNSHLCLLSQTEKPALFCGDTLFNAGVGHCKIGGNPDQLYNSFSQQLAILPANTHVYPGHDYMINNLQFTINREPDNERAKKFLKDLENQNPHFAYISKLSDENHINSFFRLQSPSIIKHLREKIFNLPAQPSEKEVFLALRELRDDW